MLSDAKVSFFLMERKEFNCQGRYVCVCTFLLVESLDIYSG